MNDYRDNIGRHFTNDDRRLWEFTRDSKIAHGTFDKGVSPDLIVFIGCLIAALLGLGLALWN